MSWFANVIYRPYALTRIDAPFYLNLPGQAVGLISAKYGVTQLKDPIFGSAHRFVGFDTDFRESKPRKDVSYRWTSGIRHKISLWAQGRLNEHSYRKHAT